MVPGGQRRLAVAVADLDGIRGFADCSKSTTLSQVTPKLPAFEQYARVAKLTGLTPTPLERGTTEPEPIRGSSASDALGAIFASFAAFENTRSEGRLKQLRPHGLRR